MDLKKDILIKEKYNCPYIETDFDLGIIIIKGNSFPENAFDFYSFIINWVNNYSKSPKKNTIVTFNLDNVNAASFKCFYLILKELKGIKGDDKKIVIYWKYSDDYVFELGKELELYSNFLFVYKDCCVEYEY